MSSWKQAIERACQAAPERSRCEPTDCQMASRCAMTDSARRGVVIDASIAARQLGACPMFVDSRARFSDDSRFAGLASRMRT